MLSLNSKTGRMSFKSKSYESAKASRRPMKRGEWPRKPSKRNTGNNGAGRHSNAPQVNLEPKKGRRKGFRSVVRDRADRYFSLFIRYRDNWQCQKCLTRYLPVTASLQNSHFYGRARESTRFSELNCDALCAGCHNFLGANPELYREWKLQRIGEDAYMKLRILAESRCKKDRKLMAIIWKQEYEKEKARYELELT
jgi:hypothetical protein